MLPGKKAKRKDEKEFLGKEIKNINQWDSIASGAFKRKGNQKGRTEDKTMK